MSSPKKHADSIPPLKEGGYKNLVGTPDVGMGMQMKQVTQVGASPYTLVLADHGFDLMADTTYGVFIGGTDAAVASVGSKTAAQFVVSGGTDTHVLDVLIVGRIAGMQAPDGTF